MKTFALFLLLAKSHVAAAETSAVTPVQKVTQMLTDMRAKGTSQIQVEQKIYADYSKFVRMQTRELSQEIKTSKATIEKLTAFIEKADADVSKFTREIASSDEETGTLEADQKAATEMRASGKATFLAEQSDYSESLYAIDRAIEVIKSQNYDRPQAMALLQHMTTTDNAMHKVIALLALAQSRNDQPSGAPAVAGYESQSGSIVELLSRLKDNFRKELADVEKQESNSAHAYDMEMVHLTNTLDNFKANRQELVKRKARTAGDSARAKGEVAETKTSLADAQKFLADTTATFEAKTSTYEANQKVRKEEIEALGKAIEIISNPNVSASYATHVNTELLQQAAPSSPRKLSLLQVHSGSRRQAARNAAASFLKQRARALHSKALATLVSKLTAGGPFDKVVQMIESLLAKLKEEAASEADHKAYCDGEAKKNKLKRNKKESEVESLRAQIDEAAANIAEMGKKVATLAEEQASLRKNVVEATKTRGEEKQENDVAIKDSAEAQVAVQSALAVLKDFYSKSGESFVQQAPEMAAYSGMQNSQGGVIGMLEVIQSDFARVETDTRAAESQAAREYSTFMADSEADLKAKHDAEFKLSLAKDDAEFSKEQLEKDLASSSKQLEMANSYYGELKPQCVEVHVSFEERAKTRQEEIQSLQEAYKIIDSKQR